MLSFSCTVKDWHFLPQILLTTVLITTVFINKFISVLIYISGGHDCFFLIQNRSKSKMVIILLQLTTVEFISGNSTHGQAAHIIFIYFAYFQKYGQIIIWSLQMKIIDFALKSCNLIGLEFLDRKVNEVIYPSLGLLSQSDSSLSDLPLFESS